MFICGRQLAPFFRFWTGRCVCIICHTALLHCSTLAFRKQARPNIVCVTPTSTDRVRQLVCWDLRSGGSRQQILDSKEKVCPDVSVVRSQSRQLWIGRGGVTSPQPRTEVQAQTRWFPRLHPSCQPRSRCSCPVVGGKENWLMNSLNIEQDRSVSWQNYLRT